MEGRPGERSLKANKKVKTERPVRTGSSRTKLELERERRRGERAKKKTADRGEIQEAAITKKVAVFFRYGKRAQEER